MRNFILIIYLFQTIFSYAQVARVVSGGRFPNAHGMQTNYIINYGAENNDNNVTDADAIHTRTTSSPIFGDASHAIDATSSGQKVIFTTTTQESGVKGNCEAGFFYNGDASLYEAYVEDGSSNQLSATYTLLNSTDATKQILFFPCTAGARVVIESTSASAAAIKADNVYLGLPMSIGSVDVTTSWQSYTPSNTQGFGTISAVNLLYRINKGNLEIQGGFTSGTVTASTAQLELPTGYTISGTTSARIYVGEMIRNGGSRVTVLGVQGRTYLTFGAGASSQGDVAGSSLVSSSEALLLTSISVPISQSPPQQIISQAAQGWYVAANISGANPDLGTSDITAYTEITNSSLTMTPATNSQPVGIMCSSTNAAATPTTSTSTCSAGSESIGANFNIPAVGWYEACVQFSHYGSVSGAGSINPTFQVIETPTNAQTITQEGKARISTNQTTNSSDVAVPYNNCGVFYFSSVGIKGIRLMYEQDIAATVAANILLADGATYLGQRDILFTVKPVTSGVPSPFLVGSVQSNSTGVERIERARITLGATPTISNTSSNWILANTRHGTGDNSFTFSPAFGATPVCQCTAFTSDSDTNFYTCNPSITSPSESFIRLKTRQISTTPAVADFDATVLLTCMGPK